MLERLAHFILKPFLGTGITRHWPVLRSLLGFTYQLKQEKFTGVNIPLGAKLWVSNKDLGVGVFLLTQGQYEPLTTQVLLENLNSGEVFFDIGANIGYFTVLASKRVGERGRVVAFEPAPKNIKLLKRNLELNSCQNVKIVKKAAGESGRKSQLYLSGSSWGEHSLINSSPQVKTLLVDMTSLDEWVEQSQLQPDFLKIDVEGAEMQVLQGAKRLLANPKPLKIIIEILPNGLEKAGSSWPELIDFLVSANFELKIIQENHGLHQFNRKLLEKILKKIGYTNLFCQR